MTTLQLDADDFLDRFRRMHAALEAHGFAPMSDWWFGEIDRFVRALSTGTLRQWLARVGRRGRKSTTWCELGVAWSQFGAWRVRGGTRAVIAYVSVSLDEARERLRTIAGMLTALGVRFAQRADEIELLDTPVVFRTFACTITSVVGFESVAIFGDEVSRWETRDAAANPAKDVIGSLRPTLATQPFGFLVLGSSPWSVDDFHAQSFDRGEDGTQVVSYAPSWVANPTLTEAGTRSLEPDDRIWRREFLAEPQAATAAVFDPELIRRAQRDVPSGVRFAAGVLCVDLSSGRGDAAAWGLARWAWTPAENQWVTRRGCLSSRIRDRQGNLITFDEPIRDEHGERIPNPAYKGRPQPTLVFGPVASLTGRFADEIRSDELIDRICADARAWGAAAVIADSHLDYGVEPDFRRNGVQYLPQQWSIGTKGEAVGRIRSWLRDGRLVLPLPTDGDAAARLSTELAAFQESLSPSGRTRYRGRTGVHDDHVAALLNAAMADVLGLLPQSPTAPRPYQIDWRDLPPA